MKEKLNCILVVDDDEPTNFINTMLIEEAACTRHLEMVDSGVTALNYLKNAISGREGNTPFILPDLIFLDINMPQMNGWEFLDEYKNLEHTRLANTAIIVLTSSFNLDDKLKAESIAQVSGFEIKPLTTEMIQRVIKICWNPQCKSGLYKPEPFSR